MSYYGYAGFSGFRGFNDFSDYGFAHPGFGYPGFGAAPPPPSYGQLLGGIVQEVTTRPDIMGNLSPPVRGVVQAMRMSMDKALGKSLSLVGAANVPPASIDAIAQVTVQTINLITGTVATTLAGTAASEVVSAVADIIPFISGIVQFVVAALSPQAAASGVGECASDVAQRAAWCQAQYAPVRGTGTPDSPIVACDLFTNTSANAYGEKRTSSVGDALEVITEPPYYVPPPYKIYEMIKKMGGQTPKWLKPGLGIPKDIQELFKRMRLAMRDSCANPNLDGGNSIFPLYLDLLRMQFKLGRMNKQYARWIMDAWWGNICGGSVNDKWESCMDHESRGLQQVFGLVEGWDNTIIPKHDPGGKKAAAIVASESQIIAQANKELYKPKLVLLNLAAANMLLRKTAPKKAIPNRKPIKRIVLRPKKKLTPAKAVGVGAGAAAVLLLLL